MVERTGRHFLACIVAVMGMTAAVVSAATLHVSSAAGGPGEGTATAPFAAVSTAVEAALTGDTIVVHKGNYLVTSAITIDKPGLKIIGISGERPVITAREDVATVFNLIGNDVVLQDLTIRGGYYGVKVDENNGQPARNVVIRNCTIGSTAADCIKTFKADGLLIEDCQIGPSGLTQKENAEGIDVIGSIGVVIRGCLVQDVATNGIYLKGGTRDGLVERCFVQRAGHGGILLGQDTDLDAMRDRAENEAISCTARNNIVVDTKSAGLGTYSGSGISFLNNTLVNVARDHQAGIWIVTNSREVPAENIIIRSNIVAVGGERPLVFMKDAAGLPDCDYNVYHVARGEPRFVRELGADESLNKQWTLEQWQKAAGKDRHSRLGEPKLDTRQYRPQAGSPAIGAGDKGKVDVDYFGHRRNGNSADAGAVMASAGPDPAQK